MKWILEHFQLVVILVGAFLLWLKGMFEKRAAERRQKANPPASPAPGHYGSDPEYWEVPVERPVVQPPPLPVPGARTEVIAVRPPAPDRRRRGRAGSRRKPREAKAIAGYAGSAPPARSESPAKPVRTPAASAPAALRLRLELRHPPELRRAVVLREILGPPVGLR
jgi:hypothetical protein